MEEFGEREKDRYKRAVLIAAGSFYGLPFSLKEDDFLVAIDGGMHYCEEFLHSALSSTSCKK